MVQLQTTDSCLAVASLSRRELHPGQGCIMPNFLSCLSTLPIALTSEGASQN